MTEGAKYIIPLDIILSWVAVSAVAFGVIAFWAALFVGVERLNRRPPS